MKVIKDIANAELKRLFYSPIAFLLLIIFSFLVAGVFVGIMETMLRFKAFQLQLSGLSVIIFGSTETMAGLYENQIRFIYLFFPLLTMNMFSRDMGSGAFKLLMSSPVKNSQIVLGKYLSLVVFSLALVALIGMYAVYGIFKIENPDLPLILSGLSGIFLLCCIYSAIGLFLSSLTTYPIVAALCTLTLLMVMTFINGMGQEYPIIRDITYWLSMEGRAKNFMVGIISSEDLIYFLTIIFFFLSLTTIRLRSKKEKRSRLQVISQYATVTLVMCVIGYFTSMPKFKVYADMTREKRNTLSRESQRVVSKLDSGLTITTYVNAFDVDAMYVQPFGYKRDVARYNQYTRFKPEINLNYVYYYKLIPGGPIEKYYKGLSEEQILDTLKRVQDLKYEIVPYKEIASKVDLSSENYHMVSLIERENGKKTFLRFYDDAIKFPKEEQITAALKRLVEPLPSVGFVGGHGERTCNSENDRGYSLFAQDKSFRYSLVNNGFDFETVSLMAPVPDHIDILVIADARKPFNETELKNYRDYLDRGGNLFMAADLEKQEVMNSIGEPVGISFQAGMLAHANPELVQNVIPFNAVDSSRWIGKPFDYLKRSTKKIIMNGACAIKIDTSKGFTSLPLFVSDSSQVWNEVETPDVLEDSAIFNAAAGEMKQPFAGAMALERKINGKSQKILVSGDADWISNLEILAVRKYLSPANFEFVNLGFYWLSDFSVPIDTSRDEPIDNKIDLEQESFKVVAVLFKWGIPVLLLATGLFIWIRRKGR